MQAKTVTMQLFGKEPHYRLSPTTNVIYYSNIEPGKQSTNSDHLRKVEAGKQP